MKKMKILVVDNNPLIVKLVGNLLARDGHEVLAAEDGLSALDILRDETPDIIIVDLIMPNISGSQLCRIIRDNPRLSDVFIVILSGIVAEGAVDPADLKADVCIAKGPAQNMGRHLVLALKLAEEKKGGAEVAPQSIGFDEVYQREITKELLASKQETEVLLNHMAEGIVELFPADNRIIYANPAALALIGLPEEKVLGRQFISLFDKKQQRRLIPLLKALDSGPQTINDDAPVFLGQKQLTLHLLPPADDGH
ncbi:MAG: response regulator, partial [Desulfobulbaceae bacterium]|nr:response regulator [Desulfobulbaceae bacterium]